MAVFLVATITTVFVPLWQVARRIDAGRWPVRTVRMAAMPTTTPVRFVGVAGWWAVIIAAMFAISFCVFLLENWISENVILEIISAGG